MSSCPDWTPSINMLDDVLPRRPFKVSLRLLRGQPIQTPMVDPKEAPRHLRMILRGIPEDDLRLSIRVDLRMTLGITLGQLKKY